MPKGINDCGVLESQMVVKCKAGKNCERNIQLKKSYSIRFFLNFSKVLNRFLSLYILFLISLTLCASNDLNIFLNFF